MHNPLKIIIDTFSWTKLFKLENNGWEKLVDIILDNISVLLTHEIKQELEYRHPNKTHYLKRTTLLPIIDIDFQYFEINGFDKADASIIKHCEKSNIPAVTEDHPMLTLGTVDKMDFIQLADFLYILNELDLITNNEFHKLLRILREMRNITKNKHKKLLKKI